MSVARVTERSASATATMTSSPAAWPKASLTCLSRVDVDEDAVHGVALPACLLDHLRADHGQPAPVGDAGQVVAHRGRLGRCASARPGRGRPPAADG